MKRTLTITGEVARKAICRHVLTADEGYIVTIAEPSRNLEQNAKMWAMLNDIARQVMWPINGVPTHITPEDWKDLITAGLAKHQRIAQGLEGGVVMLGSRTSRMSKKELAEIVDEARNRWPLGRVTVIHRIGELWPGDEIVFVGVTSAHRSSAFEAGQFIMDYLKTRAPFWKREATPEGDRWVEARESDQQAAKRW